MKGEGIHVVEAGQELETCIRASIPRHLVLQMQTRVAKRTHDEMCNKEKPRVHLNYENQVRLGLVSLLRAWRGSMNDRNPVDLLANILASRGYRTSHILPKLPGKDRYVIESNHVVYGFVSLVRCFSVVLSQISTG